MEWLPVFYHELCDILNCPSGFDLVSTCCFIVISISTNLNNPYITKKKIEPLEIYEI